MKIIVISVFLALISGCASSSKTYGPDGRPSYALNCSGLARNWSMCFEKAGDLCKEKGCEVILVNGEYIPTLAAQANPQSASVFASSLISRTMTITCKN